MELLVGKILLAILISILMSAITFYAGYKFAQKLDEWSKRKRR